MGGQGFSELCSVALDGECWLNFGSHALLCATLDQLCCRLLHLSSQQQQQLQVQIFKKIVTESVKFPQERYALFWFPSSTIEVFVVWSSTTSLPVIHPLRTFLESHHGCKLPDPNPPLVTPAQIYWGRLPLSYWWISGVPSQTLKRQTRDIHIRARITPRSSVSALFWLWLSKQTTEDKMWLLPDMINGRDH